jgi:hypothetical protein
MFYFQYDSYFKQLDVDLLQTPRAKLPPRPEIEELPLVAASPILAKVNSQYSQQSKKSLRKSMHVSYEDQLQDPPSKPAFIYNSSHVRDIEDLRAEIQEVQTIKRSEERKESSQEEVK